MTRYQAKDSVRQGPSTAQTRLRHAGRKWGDTQLPSLGISGRGGAGLGAARHTTGEPPSPSALLPGRPGEQPCEKGSKTMQVFFLAVQGQCIPGLPIPAAWHQYPWETCSKLRRATVPPAEVTGGNRSQRASTVQAGAMHWASLFDAPQVASYLDPFWGYLLLAP